MGGNQPLIALFGGFAIGLIGGGLAVYVYMDDHMDDGPDIPAPPYSYFTTETSYYGWPVKDPETFVGAPGRCWIGQDGICTHDETGVRVPSEKQRPRE